MNPSHPCPAVITSELLAQGTVIREPVGSGRGYWVGSPGACYDDLDRAWYLTYRIRRPHGVQPDRGGEVRIARSTDLQTWQDVAAFRKQQYDSASVERSCLHRGPDGQWRYFTSYVHADDGRWCTAVMKAPQLAQLDPAKRTVVFAGPPLGLEGVKDPWVIERDGVFHLFTCVAIPTPATGDGAHATRDIFTTGQCQSATGLATSRDLDRWDWQGIVHAPDRGGWDRYCRRLNSIVPLATGRSPEPVYLGFYDGCADHLENYEERCGLAVSDDLIRWRTLSRGGPRFSSPHASNSLRYLDAKLVHGKVHLFYEFARSDGAHDLRLIVCDPAALASIKSGDDDSIRRANPGGKRADAARSRVPLHQAQA